MRQSIKRDWTWNSPIGTLNITTGSTKKEAIAHTDQKLLEIWQARYDRWRCGKDEWTHNLIQTVGIEIQVLDYYLAQALSGHGAFREWLFRFRKSTSPFCEWGALETPQHVFTTSQEFLQKADQEP